MSIAIGRRPQIRPLTRNEMRDEQIAPGDYFGTTGGNANGVWFFDGTRAVRVGIANPDHRSMVNATDQASLRKALSEMMMFAGQDFTIHRMSLPPGAYHPRIARPSDQHPEEGLGSFPGYAQVTEALVISLNQMRSLVQMLEAVFQAVHPDTANMNSYGAAIRNLLILACTECETQWRAVLAENGYIRDRYTTKDYVKLLPAMRLDEYSVRLQRWPWLQTIAPFQGWEATKPTKSLRWYDDYNATKHDRESHFNRATMRSAIEAVSAAWVMIAASYGLHGIRHFEDVDRFMIQDRVPRWRYSDVYTYPYAGHHEMAGSVAYRFE